MPNIDPRTVGAHSMLAIHGLTAAQANAAREAIGLNPLPPLASNISDARAKSRAMMLAEVKRQGLIKDGGDDAGSADPRIQSKRNMQALLKRMGVESAR